jgi:hypothetical protein
VLFVVLFLAGALLVNLPFGDDPPRQIASFYTDKNERTQLIVSGYLFVLAGVVFLWFLASLRIELVAAEGVPGRLTIVAFGGGLIFVALLMAAGAIQMSVATNIAFNRERFVSAEAARLVPDLAIPIVNIAAMFAAIAMIVATSILCVSPGALPKWLGWFGFIVAFVLLFSPVLAPAWTFPLWVLVVSVVLIRPRPEPNEPQSSGIAD